MAGLNDFLTGSTAKTTTLPQWYDTAQQQLVSQAQAGAGQVPQLQNTVAGQAINNLSGAQNPFFTAQNQLQQIGAGAANPWIVDQSTGQVSPNVNTAMGGLFQAQNQQLNQLMPTMTAPAQAGAVGSGNFGSLRGQTAVNTAKANALANLQAEQMKAALQAQQTGVQAGSALGNIGAQGTSTMTTLGQAQQASPLTAVGNLAQILGSVKAPASVTSTTELAPLQMIGALGGLGGALGSATLPFVNQISGNNYSSIAEALGAGANSLFNSLFRSGGNDFVTTIPNNTNFGDIGYGWQYFSNGTAIDPSGNYYYQGDQIWSPSDYS
jgi:hypothetical protein